MYHGSSPQGIVGGWGGGVGVNGVCTRPDLALRGPWRNIMLGAFMKNVRPPCL